MTLNTILKELKDFPADRLDELHQFIQSLIPTAKQKERDRKKILSFGGAFGDMSKKDYSDFVRQTKKKAKLFDRSIGYHSKYVFSEFLRDVTESYY